MPPSSFEDVPHQNRSRRAPSTESSLLSPEDCATSMPLLVRPPPPPLSDTSHPVQGFGVVAEFTASRTE